MLIKCMSGRKFNTRLQACFMLQQSDTVVERQTVARLMLPHTPALACKAGQECMADVVMMHMHITRRTSAADGSLTVSTVQQNARGRQGSDMTSSRRWVPYNVRCFLSGTRMSQRKPWMIIAIQPHHAVDDDVLRRPLLLLLIVGKAAQ